MSARNLQSGRESYDGYAYEAEVNWEKMLVDVASREADGQSRSEEIVKVRVEDVASGARLDEMIDGRMSHPIAIAIAIAGC